MNRKRSNCIIKLHISFFQGLIDLVNDSIRKGRQTRILEVGCGSGAISLSLAYENKNVHCTAIDISKEACELAEQNCSRFVSFCK